ncbi:hypothetical protein LIER_13409 [Lithospermum erythrorhizon]|uniref:GIR1-like zinc ribbon domain-containing protein n=1 Tax=Lithospermum erythrorhizon TaxID=34254 RepID=A0AAV3PYJ4_LITER
MAAEVTSIMRLMKGGDRDDSRVELVTMDLLGGYSTLDSKELNLDDLQVPSGFENRLDMKSGKLYLHNTQNLTSSTIEQKQADDQMRHKFDNLDYPQVIKKPWNLLDDGGIDLKLVPSSVSSPSLSTYQSVCTLDKVKSALERAEKEAKRNRSAVSISASKASSSPSSNSSSSIKGSEIDQEDNSPESFATGCPSCLLYVLISKSDPKCPRCKTVIPSAPTLKKPRIDLNISI